MDQSSKPDPKSDREPIRLGFKSSKPKAEETQSEATKTRKKDRIRFSCQHCKSRVKANFGQEGKQFFCPFCHKAGTVPDPDKPYLGQDSFGDSSNSVRTFILSVICFVLFVCVLYVQRKTWMPLVGLQPSQPVSSQDEKPNKAKKRRIKTTDAASKAMEKASKRELGD